MKCLNKLLLISIGVILISTVFSNVIIAENEIVALENRIDVISIQPLYDEMKEFKDDDINVYPDFLKLPEGIDNDAVLIEAAASKLAKLDYCTYLNNYKNDNVPYDIVKTFSKNQIIIWQGHGDYIDSNIHGVIETGRLFLEDYLLDDNYKQDYEDGLIVSVNGNEAITSKYIDKYCNNLENTFIYLGQCECGRDPGLAYAFLNKGAAAVIASNKTINIRYGDMMQYEIIRLLSEGKSLNEALEQAKNNICSSDPQGAMPTIYGNKDYKLSNIRYPQNIFYDGTEKKAFIDSNEYSISGTNTKTNVGEYEVTLSLNEGYVWPDNTKADKTFSWKINKGIIQDVYFTKPQPVEITYDGLNHKMLKEGEILSDKLAGCKFLYSINLLFEPEPFDTNIYEDYLTGDYEMNWYLKGNDNYEDYGSEIASPKCMSKINKIDRVGIHIIMNDYYYGDNISIPILSEEISDEDNIIKFYYYKQEDEDNVKEWKNMDIDSLQVGTYYIYAKIINTELIYYDYETNHSRFNVLSKNTINPTKNKFVIPKTGV